MIHNIAHRGASAYEPENTLRSFERAIQMGATMLELDIYISKVMNYTDKSAVLARYLFRPPWRAISRLTVEGGRFSAAAIVRIESPAARPREISSRSANDR